MTDTDATDENPEDPQFTPALLGPKAIERLAREVPIEKVIATIKDMMEANMTAGNAAAKLVAAGMEPPPDWRAREAALKLWLSYVVGMPIQRQHIVHDKPRRSNPEEDFENSPAAQAAALRYLRSTPEGREMLAQEAKTIQA